MRRDQGCLALVVVAPLVDGYKEEGVAGSVGNATARLLTQAGFSLPCCQVCCMKPALIAVLCIHTNDPGLSLVPICYLKQQLQTMFTSLRVRRRQFRP